MITRERSLPGRQATAPEPGRSRPPGPARSRPPERTAWSEAPNRGSLIRRALLIGDVVGLSLAFVLCQAFAPSAGGIGRAKDGLVDVAIFLVALPLWVVAAKLAGLYSRDEQRADYSTADDFFRVLNLLTLGTWIFYAAGSATSIAGGRLTEFFLFWLFSVILIITCRAIMRSIARRHPAFVQNTVIVGAGEVGQVVARKILHHPEYGMRLLGFVDTLSPEQADGLEALPLLGRLDDLHDLVPRLRVERVIVAFSTDSYDRTVEVVRTLRDTDVHVDIVPRLFELVPETADIHTLQGMTLIGLPSLRLSWSSLLLKRIMDLLVAGVALVVLAPVLIAIAIVVKLDSSGPAFFRQVRMGRGEPFVMFKFRTMFANADEQKDLVADLNRHAQNGGDARMFKIPNDPRVTRVGRFLRKYSLDELPQLFNVVLGDMSLVGPRPLILEEHRHIDGWARRRLELKPGITGLWQISGRDAVPFGEMVRLDYFYVTTWSPWNDIRILFRTLPMLDKGERAARPALT